MGCLKFDFHTDMMGSGYLTLPRAFADAGLVWGLSILVAVAIGATAAAECLLDCMARAGWIAAARALPSPVRRLSSVMDDSTIRTAVTAWLADPTAAETT